MRRCPGEVSKGTETNLKDVSSAFERKEKTVDLHTKLCLLYEGGLRVVLPVQVALVVELSRRVTELGGKFDGKELQLQVLSCLAEEKAFLRSKVTRVRTAMTGLQSESDAVVMVMDKIRPFSTKTKDVGKKIKNLRKQRHELKVEWRKSS